jgi:hypothetical protein
MTLIATCRGKCWITSAFSEMDYTRFALGEEPRVLTGRSRLCAEGDCPPCPGIYYDDEYPGGLMSGSEYHCQTRLPSSRNSACASPYLASRFNTVVTDAIGFFCLARANLNLASNFVTTWPAVRGCPACAKIIRQVLVSPRYPVTGRSFARGGCSSGGSSPNICFY